MTAAEVALAQPDTQQVEVIGRGRLVEALVLDGVEVALPVRDRGVDLVAYLDRPTWAAVPLQLKASTHTGWGLSRKYERTAGVVLVYAWHVFDPGAVELRAMTYADAVAIAEEMGYARSASWTEHGSYSVTNVRPGRLCDLLDPYLVTPGSGQLRALVEKAAAVS